jgi:hypothetical protein
MIIEIDGALATMRLGQEKKQKTKNKINNGSYMIQQWIPREGNRDEIPQVGKLNISSLTRINKWDYMSYSYNEAKLLLVRSGEKMRSWSSEQAATTGTVWVLLYLSLYHQQRSRAINTTLAGYYLQYQQYDRSTK